MLTILSPSKTQVAGPFQSAALSQPLLIDQVGLLIKRLRELTLDDITELMKISDKLAKLTRERIRNFSIPHNPNTAGAALLTFQGEAFSGITTEKYSEEDFAFAQQHLRILSGLYGVLRPLDMMQPYRLEMGARLQTSRGSTLYEFWGDLITQTLNSELTRMKERVIINCASKEYSRAVHHRAVNGRILTVSFRQRKNGVIKTIAIYAKRARGLFADYIVRNRITEKEALCAFDLNGYRFAPELSSDSEFVFITDLS